MGVNGEHTSFIIIYKFLKNSYFYAFFFQIPNYIFVCFRESSFYADLCFNLEIKTGKDGPQCM